MRLFVAVNFEAAVRDRISEAIDRFPVARPPWRWTRPENWHVTLKFLGELGDSDVATVGRCLDGVAARHRSFPLELDEFGGFPNLRNPRVLFYRVGRGADELRALARDVDQTLLDLAGIPRETKRFRAHVTLARVKTRLDPSVVERLASVRPLAGAGQTVTSFELVQSTLHREGARYEGLKAFALPTAP